MSSQETHTLRENYDHRYSMCVCMCVHACVRHSRWRLYELSHSLFMTAPRWQSQTQRTTCLQLWASQFRHRKVTRFFILLDKQCVYIRTCDLLDRWRCACSSGEHMGKKWRVRVFAFIPQVMLLLEIKTKQNKTRKPENRYLKFKHQLFKMNKRVIFRS